MLPSRADRSFCPRLAWPTCGEPDAITRFVESHGVDVVVMGTVARSGIAGPASERRSFTHRPSGSRLSIDQANVAWGHGEELLRPAPQDLTSE